MAVGRAVRRVEPKSGGLFDRRLAVGPPNDAAAVGVAVDGNGAQLAASGADDDGFVAKVAGDCREAAGLGLAAGIETSETMQLVVLAAVVLVATSSAVSGVRRGVRVLSNLNMLMSVVLLAFFLTFGPTRHILGSLIQASGDYFQNLIALSTWLDVNRHSDWQETWTVFYWAWWIAWSPFVGMFIARISRGRTIREFVMGVLLVPAIFTFVWLAITGGTAGCAAAPRQAGTWSAVRGAGPWARREG